MGQRARVACCAGLAGILFGAIVVMAQDSGANISVPEPRSTNDLAAAAKLAREQRDAEKPQRTERSQAVNELARDLAREQDEPIAGAPIGYRYYYFRPGDYAILVPADSKPHVRDSYGLRLRSEEAFSFNIEVILGEPIPARGDTPEEQIHNANAAYFEGCAFDVSGLSPSVDGHPALGIGYSGCSLSQEILGTGELVVGDGYVVPVICGYPFRPEDLDPNPHQPIQKVINKYDRERAGWNICKLILPSLRFHPYGNRWNPKGIAAPEKKIAATGALALPGNEQLSVTAEGQQSLGIFARTHRVIPTHAAMTELKHVAAGYSAFSYRYYCTADRVNCYSLSLQIPAQAKLNQNFVMQYIGLFQFEVPGSKGAAVIQATTGPPSESGVVSREEMIKTKADWFMSYVPADHYAGVGPGKVLSEELTEISGIPARLTTFSNASVSGAILTYMGSYMVPGKFVHVRCSVPETVSGDFQSLCESVLRSMEVQMPKSSSAAQDNPPSDDLAQKPGQPESENDDH